MSTFDQRHIRRAFSRSAGAEPAPDESSAAPIRE